MPHVEEYRHTALRQRGRWVAVMAALLAAGAIAASPTASLTQMWAQAGPSGSSPASMSHIHGLAVDPFDSRVLWVATHTGLVKVTNRLAWTRVGSDQADLMGFTVHPSRRGVLFTSGHPGPGDRRPNPLGLAISRDGGQRWKSVALAGGADFHAMAISSADPRIIYAWNVWQDPGTVEGFYRSRDGGETWEALGRAGFAEVFALRAHPQQPHTVLAATNRGLLRSLDSGRSWAALHARLSGVVVSALDVHPRTPALMYAYTGASHLGLIRSTDAGQTWSSLGFHQGDRDAVSHLALDPADPAVLYLATASGSLFWSWDGGRSLRRLVTQGRVERP